MVAKELYAFFLLHCQKSLSLVYTAFDIKYTEYSESFMCLC